jgi:DNA-3-methyladenine glycosylase II
LRAFGFSSRKAQYIISISRFALEGGGKNAASGLEALESLPDEEAEAGLLTLRGVGRWSAQYVLLRGMGRLGVFPGDDVGARAKLSEWLGVKSGLDYEGVRRIAVRWHPYGGLIYFHLLLKSLRAKGFLPIEREEVSA